MEHLTEFIYGGLIAIIAIKVFLCGEDDFYHDCPLDDKISYCDRRTCKFCWLRREYKKEMEKVIANEKKKQG